MALDPSLRALKQQIWAAEDATKAEDALAKARKDALGKMSPDAYVDALQYQRDFWEMFYNPRSSGASASGIKWSPPKVHGFDSGGYHPGGMRVVGEKGPELEWTGPSRIYSNSDSKDLLGSSELVSEVKKLRKDLGDQNFSIVENTGKFAKLLSRWDGDGIPETRESDVARWG